MPHSVPSHHHTAIQWGARLGSGEGLGGLGLGKVAGRWDLRGRTMSEPATSPMVVDGYNAVNVKGYDELIGVALEGIDLSGAIWPHLRLSRVRIRDCVLDDARIPGLRSQAVDVTDSSFRGADMRDAGMSGHVARIRPRYSTWVGVDFTGADLRGSGHGVEQYIDCSFSKARLDEVNFLGARHVRSRFEGRLDDVFFYRKTPLRRSHNDIVNNMERVDFTRAQVVGGRFWGLGLEDSYLPTGAHHLIVHPKVAGARSVLEQLNRARPARNLVELRVIMELLIAEGPERPSARGIVHRELLGRDEPERERGRAFLRKALGDPPRK